MILIYNLGIRFYALLIRFASLFNTKAKQFVVGRKEVFEQLSMFKNQSSSPIAWFHAASLGEFEQGLPVMEEFKEQYPKFRLLVTFFSPSGYEQRKEHPLADFVCYLPTDTKSKAKRFVEIMRPQVVFFIKYEYWFHFLSQIHMHKIPLYSLSALFTPGHIFFKPYGAFHRRMLKYFDFTFVQNESSLQLLQHIGIEEVAVSGDTRFDRVLRTIAQPNHYLEVEEFKGTSKLCIIGSAWPSDMAVLNDFINQASPDLKFVIAPHLIDYDHIKKIVSGIKIPWHRYSESVQVREESQVLILDTIGMLSSIYQYGDFAYIGGAFGDGLHNILEAVAFGLPVVYGNRGLEKFPESVTLKALGGGFTVANSSEAGEILGKLNCQDDFRKHASGICKEYVLENAGATEKIMSYLKAKIQ